MILCEKGRGAQVMAQHRPLGVRLSLGDIYKSPSLSNSILPLAGACGSGSHLMPLLLLRGGATAGAAGGMSSAQARPSGASRASLCGWLGGPAAAHPDGIAEAAPASGSIGSSRMSPWEESRCQSPAAPCGEVTATRCSSNLAKNQMRTQMFREQNALC